MLPKFWDRSNLCFGFLGLSRQKKHHGTLGGRSWRACSMRHVWLSRYCFYLQFYLKSFKKGIFIEIDSFNSLVSAQIRLSFFSFKLTHTKKLSDIRLIFTICAKNVERTFQIISYSKNTAKMCTRKKCWNLWSIR